jgi:hypothetical protein
LVLDRALGISLRPEHRVVLFAVCGRDEGYQPEVFETGKNRDLDWPRILDFAERHGVASLLLHRLSRPGFAVIPPGAVDQLRAYCRPLVATSLHLTSELGRILTSFDERGVLALAWKGPTLAAVAYDDVTLRTFGDLDLIVAPGEIGPALDALSEIGYAKQYKLTRLQTRALRHGNHEEKVVRNGELVELHWQLAKSVFRIGLDFDALWERRGSVVIAGRPIPVLSPEDLLLSLCVHGSTHAWKRLLWISDVAQVVRAVKLDWGQVLNRAETLGINRSVRVAFRLAEGLLDAPLPTAVANWVSADEEVEALANRVAQEMFRSAPTPASFVSFQWRVQEGFRRKLAVGLQSMFSPAPEDWTLVPLPDIAYPLYFIIRPVRLLAKYLTPWRAKASDLRSDE